MPCKNCHCPDCQAQQARERAEVCYWGTGCSPKSKLRCSSCATFDGLPVVTPAPPPSEESKRDPDEAKAHALSMGRLASAESKEEPRCYCVGYVQPECPAKNHRLFIGGGFANPQPKEEPRCDECGCPIRLRAPEPVAPRWVHVYRNDARTHDARPKANPQPAPSADPAVQKAMKRLHDVLAGAPPGPHPVSDEEYRKAIEESDGCGCACDTDPHSPGCPANMPAPSADKCEECGAALEWVRGPCPQGCWQGGKQP